VAAPAAWSSYEVTRLQQSAGSGVMLETGLGLFPDAEDLGLLPQDALTAGSRTSNVVPRPSSLSTLTRPPWFSAT
jgi:hypothetical protein